MARLTKEQRVLAERRRRRQGLGLAVLALVVVGFITLISWIAGGIGVLLDDSKEREEYARRLQGLVMLDPTPFASVEAADPNVLREAGIWGVVYRQSETAGGLEAYERDEESGRLIIPAVEVENYLAGLFGPGYKLQRATFMADDMTYDYSEKADGFLIPVTGNVARYVGRVDKLERRDGRLYATVGYIPTTTDDLTLSAPTEPVKYMDYVFSRDSNRRWYLTALADSEMEPAASPTPAPVMELDPTEALQNAVASSGAAQEAAVPVIEGAVIGGSSSEEGQADSTAASPAADSAASSEAASSEAASSEAASSEGESSSSSKAA